ncbi:hypothetical protein AB0A70_19145 [Streptomyces morookaense]|uniref:hypothetical protein n=1 Tax=Streptomyces morookaense TaxID=1970 RepID=UPI0033FD1448
MGAGRVAGVTRAKAVLSRRLGASGARDIAASGTPAGALRRLTDSPYRRGVDAGATLEEAQRAVTSTLLWNLRVLAGWQPRDGVNALRVLAAGFEIANVRDMLRASAGADSPPPYRLRALATAWPRISRARTNTGVRAALAASPWGDPGEDSPAALVTGMRISAAVRMASTVPCAGDWAAGRAALLVARERFVSGRRLTEPSARRASRLLGPEAVRAPSFPEFRRLLPRAARWATEGAGRAEDLWRAEAHWWKRIEQDGLALARRSGYGIEPVVGAVAVLSADAWRVRGALELAARGGPAGEADDVLV